MAPPDLYQIHEDRILRMEDSLLSSHKLLAEHTLTLDNINDTVAEVRVEIEDKIDRGFSSLQAQLTESGKIAGKAVDLLAAQEARIKALEEVEAKRKDRWQKVKRTAVWIAAGVGGVFLKTVGEWIIHLVG